MTKKETMDAITEILRIYDETRDTTPKNTAQKIVESLGVEKAGEAVAVMIKDCSWDGRISPANKDYWQNVKSWEKNSERETLDVVGLSSLHRTHLDQLAGELMKIHQLSRTGEDEQLPTEEESTPTIKQTM